MASNAIAYGLILDLVSRTSAEVLCIIIRQRDPGCKRWSFDNLA